MKLAALVDSPNHVCCRYRFAAFQKPLEASGHQLDLVPYPSSLWRRFRLGSDLAHYDAVIIQRRLLPRWILNRLRARVRHLLFDLDDAIYLRDSYHPRGLYDLRRLRAFSATVRAADIVIGGNSTLADAARRQGAARVCVIPTCVDPARYPLCLQRREGPTQLVWIGSSSTLKGLKQMAPMLEQVGREVPNVRLKLICDSFLRFEHLQTDEVNWSESNEATDLASADIGIAWMPDDDWSRGKCGLKVLQYMAAGLPVIANPVGVHTDMVRHGETGYLASTADEWEQAVAKLVSDPGKRLRMGEAGRALLTQCYSVEAGATLWKRVLDEVRLNPRVSA